MKNILLLICILISIKNYSQELIIEELIITDIKYDYNPKIINEGGGKGPYLVIVLTLHNNTEEDIFLDKISSKTEISYNHNREKYIEEIFWDSVLDFNVEKISPNTSITFQSGTHLFLGTNLWEEKKTDYTLELLEAIPTLRIKYIDKNHKFTSTSINNVKIKH